MGSRVGTSPSAAMHTAMLAACGLEGTYELRVVGEGELPAFVAELRSGRYDGCNVTMPHKLHIAAMCDALRGDAALLDAVNTVVVEAGSIIGDNTDARGFEAALRVQRMTPTNDGTALVMGAGGAAAAVTLALQRMSIDRVLIAARRREQVEAIASRLPALDVVPLPWDAPAVAEAAASVAVVVNATPLDAAELPLDLRYVPSSCTVADVRYRPRPIALVEQARALGLPACDGLEMLLQQGLLSFSMWTGAAAPEPAARTALLAAIHA
ncbi:MAG: hypothetical protein JOZ92_07780 [Candidatus Dormibacteraeota bacterium]|nr:hypothetical protein [Candidatus Dormibacteraeota bacterium]